MSSNSPAFTLSNGLASDSDAPQQVAQSRWSRLPVAGRSPVWPGILGTLIIFAMLLAFHQVVLGAVEQGASRHKALAVHAEASLRCNTLPDRGASELCLRQLNSVASGDPRALGQTELLASRD